MLVVSSTVTCIVFVYPLGFIHQEDDVLKWFKVLLTTKLAPFGCSVHNVRKGEEKYSSFSNGCQPDKSSAISASSSLSASSVSSACHSRQCHQSRQSCQSQSRQSWKWWINLIFEPSLNVFRTLFAFLVTATSSFHHQQENCIEFEARKNEQFWLDFGHSGAKNWGEAPSFDFEAFFI